MANNRELSQFASTVGYNGSNIGIGTDNPGAKLEVRDGSSQGIIVRSDNTQATDTNKALRVRNNSDTNTFHVSHKGQGYFAGDVGIGTDNPLNGLDIVSSTGRTRVTAFGHIISRNHNHSTTNYWSIAPRNGGELDIGYGAADGDGVVASDKLTITTGGKVSITSGTNSGDAPSGGDNLVIKDSDGCGISLLSADGNSSNVYLGSQTDEDAVRLEGFYNSASPYFNIYTGGTERLRIDSSGNLLLKTGEIDIQGGNKTVKTSAGFLQLGTSGSHHTAIITSGTERLRITSDGIIKTPNLQGNNHREIHRHITGFSSGSSVVNYLLICETSRTNVRLAGRLLTARSSGTSACSSQLFDITFQTNHDASHRSGAIMGLHSGSNGYGHAEAEIVSLTYNSTNYYAIRFSDGWVTDFDTCSFDGIREHTGTELFTHIDSTNETITNVSVLNAATNMGDVTIQQADLRISDGDVIMASGHGISFSADGNASGMSSELLDDYEEGTWTPTITGLGNHTNNSGSTWGKYTKVGNRVFITFRYQWTSRTTTNGGVVFLGSLPFTSTNDSRSDAVYIGGLEGVISNTGREFYGGQVVHNSTTIQFRASGHDVSENSLFGSLSTSMSSGYIYGAANYIV